MSVALLREGGKYYRKCKIFLKRVSEMSFFDRLSQKNDPHLNLLTDLLLGKINLPTPC